MTRKIETIILDPRLGNERPLPGYATDGSAAIDLRAATHDFFTLYPGRRKLVRTGLAVHIADPGLVGVIASRSGLSFKHGIRVAQGIGVIDSDYTGEIGVILQNDGDDPYQIRAGERIAQLLFQQVEHVELEIVDRFSADTERGSGGFGHTGDA